MGKLIIGCGTGRCGTKSFASLMSNQNLINSFHELFLHPKGTTFRQKYHIRRWSFDESDFKIIEPYFDSLINRDITFSEVGPYYLNFLKILQDRYKNDVKIVIIKRNKQDFIRSIYRVINEVKNQQTNFFTFKTLNKSYFYKFKLDDIESSASDYYDWFYKKIEEQDLNNYFLLKTKDLNDEQKIKKLFEYLEIEDFNFKSFHENKKPS
jgi:hypothetical protein